MKASIVEVEGISYLQLEGIETGIEIVSTELYNKLLDEVKDAEQKIFEYKNKCKILSNELASEQKKVADITRQSTEIQLKLKSTESFLANEQAKKLILEESIQSKNKEISKLKQEYNELSKQVKQLKFKNLELTNQVNECLNSDSEIFQRSMAIFLTIRHHEELAKQYLSLPAIQHYYNQYANIEVSPYKKIVEQRIC